MEISSDPYERRLYQMFESCDTEAIGSLDKNALINLCDSLELNDKGIQVISSLIKNDKKRISLKEFKEALLNYLGSEMDLNEERNFVMTERDCFNEAPDSPVREISPKLIVGSKKYGRRSRPQSTVINSTDSDSDSDEQNTVQRSSSQNEIHVTRNKRPGSGDTKLKRCLSLPNQKNHTNLETSPKLNTSNAIQDRIESSNESLCNIDFENLSQTIYEAWENYGNDLGTQFLNRSQFENIWKRIGLHKIAENVAEEVFEKLNLDPNEEICFDDFINLFKNNNATDNESSTSTIKDCSELTPVNNNLHVQDELIQFEIVPSSSILRIWENIGIKKSQLLLSNLGFDENEVNVLQLVNTLEEEIRSLNENTQVPLLRALVAIQKVQISTLQQNLRQLGEENKKLHADNRDANRRAALLAQEIDERHANLEDKTKCEIRMLQQRQAEVVKELTMQLANDRENWTNINIKLEKRIKTLEEDDNLLRTELQAMKEENCALEKEHILLQKQITELLETNIKLNNQIVELEEKGDANKTDARETEEVLELMDKIASLQIENSSLRDKHDELITEIEDLNTELNRLKCKKVSRGTVSSDHSTDVLSDESEQTICGVKRRGDSPSKARLSEESPRLGKFRKCNNDNSESETSGEWMGLNSEFKSPGSGSSSDVVQKQEDVTKRDDQIKVLNEKIDKLERELASIRKADKQLETVDDDKAFDYAARCEELESSLELMQKAYEDCEDYWQNKLSEERQLFEKERSIYEDIQNKSDLKFNELMEKIREYEEQFSKDDRLSPIAENDILEQQYMDLEAEMKELKLNTNKLLEEKTKEINSLHDQIKKLKATLSSHQRFSTETLEEVKNCASSPISYLWHQSTIHSPARDYQIVPKMTKTKVETPQTDSDAQNFIPPRISPIQKPTSKQKNNEKKEDKDILKMKDVVNCPTPSTASSEFDERIKNLRLIEEQLKDQIKQMVDQRDGLMTEVQQLQEAKPVLDKVYSRSVHPNLIQRVHHLEQKNRSLQNLLCQQQHQSDMLLQQTWHQYCQEVAELRNHLEKQNIILAEQGQRLAKAEIVVKDLCLENSRLTGTIHQYEQQRSQRSIIGRQYQGGLNSVPGMP